MSLLVCGDTSGYAVDSSASAHACRLPLGLVARRVERDEAVRTGWGPGPPERLGKAVPTPLEEGGRRAVRWTMAVTTVCLKGCSTSRWTKLERQSGATQFSLAGGGAKGKGRRGGNLVGPAVSG
ncbi:MAG: hypothetical protein U0795_13560 [Pirellulales bacterium]